MESQVEDPDLGTRMADALQRMLDQGATKVRAPPLNGLAGAVEQRGLCTPPYTPSVTLSAVRIV